MSSYSNVRISWTTNDMEFERQCCVLFSDWLDDPSAHRFSTTGAKQDGVDILCRRGRDPDRLVGVQCKLRSTYGKLTVTDLRKDVADALKFKPLLREYFYVTTLTTVGDLQQEAAALAQQQAAAGRQIDITVWGETVLSDEIHRSEKAMEAFDPGASPALKRNTETLLKVSGELSEFADARRSIEAEVTRLSSERSAVPAHRADRLLAEDLSRVMRRRCFTEADTAKELEALADSVTDGEFRLAASERRAEVCDRAARAVALVQPDKAREWRARAAQLDPTHDLTIVDALLLEAAGDGDGALRALREKDDPETRTALLLAIRRLRGSAQALSWASLEELGPTDFNPIGSFQLVSCALDTNDFGAATSFLHQTPPQHFVNLPVLDMLKAQIDVAGLAPEARRLDLMRALPLDPQGVPLAESLAAQRVAEQAIDDFGRLAGTFEDLGLAEQQQFALEFRLWLQLKNSATRAEAIKQLKSEIADPKLTARRVRLAIGYNVPFDRAALARSLKRKKELGGWRPEERFAAFMIALASDNPRAVGEFIAANRDELFSAPDFEAGGLVDLEVRSLAAAGDITGARRALDAFVGSKIDEASARSLREDLDALETGRQLEVARLRYEASPDHDNLRLLVALYAREGDQRGLATYAAELAKQTGTLDDLQLALSALQGLNDNAGMARLLRALPDLVARDDQLRALEGWSLSRSGQVMEAAPIARELLKKRGLPQDFELAVRVAIETGDWDFLQSLLDQAQGKIAAFSAHDLMRFARLAFEVGSRSVQTFRDAALAAAPDDPRINLEAHMLALDAGDEKLESKAGDWLKRAAETSGPDGPVRIVKLADVADQFASRSQAMNEMDSGLRKGELPLIMVAEALGREFTGMFLGQAIQNADPSVSGVAYPVLAFSGAHVPAQLDPSQTVGLDVSSILTLGFLGRLSDAIDRFDALVISPHTLAYLFAERRFLRVQQPSLVNRAKRVQALIASGALKTVPTRFGAPKIQEVGEELASLLAHAAETGGVVARPAPVPRIGTLSEDNADLGEMEARLADLNAVLAFLKAKGQLGASSEASAGAYVTQVDVGWTSGSVISADRPVYLDSLTISYLSFLDLLEPLARVAPVLYVHESVAADSSGWIRGERHAAELDTLIEGIRVSLRRGLMSGKVRFSARRPPDAGDRRGRGGQMPTLDLLSDLEGVDVVSVDDRFFNRAPSWDDSRGHLASVANTLDVLVALNANGDDRTVDIWEELHRLRAAGFFAVPVTSVEIVHRLLAATHETGRVLPTPELQSIRDSIDLPNIRNVDVAGDAPWFNRVRLELLRAIATIWEQDADVATKRARADWALSALPNPLLWRLIDDDDASFALARQQAVSQAAMLIAGSVNKGRAAADYKAWLEEDFIPYFTQSDPELWDQIIEDLKSFVARVIDDEEENSAEP